MKALKFLTLMVMAFGIATAYGQQAKVTGNIKGLGNAELKVYYYEGDVQKSDNVQVTADRFIWAVPMPNPQKITIVFPKRAVWVFVEKGNMELNGHADSLGNLQLKGSKTQEEANAYAKQLEQFSALEMPLHQKYGKVSKEEQLEVEMQLADIRMKKRQIAEQYIASNPESAFSLSLVTDRATMGEYRDIQEVYSKLGESIKLSPEGKRLAERLIVLKRSAIGSPILNFTQNDPSGNPVSFSAFKGKYVLVDFWASWCGPCRAENPNVLKAYNTYKDKNFTVLGVSLDDKADLWKKAILDDGMPWVQVSDLKGFKNEVSTYYGVMGIPSTLLIDPSGKIIAKDLRGELLNKKLKEIFTTSK